MRTDTIEAIYPLTPTQEGMLFHALYEPASDLYLLQYACRLRGRLDRAAFWRAWEQVIARHGALRTCFQWEGLERPAQVVLREVELPRFEADWRDLDAAEQERRWEELLQAERRAGFDLTRAPLLRFWLIERGADAWYFVWSAPHLVLDGWCVPLLFREVLALLSGAPVAALPRSRPYRDYVAWLLRQDLGEVEAFWRRELAGFTAPQQLPLARPGQVRSSESHVEATRRLDPALSRELEGFARRYRLTLNSLVQGAWALWLARTTGDGDVVFGSTVAGRSAPVPGIEAMVGLFINTLPARVAIDEDAAVVPWLRRLQERQAEARRFEHAPLAQIQGWAETGRGVPLFDTVLVFEHFVAPNEEAAAAPAAPLEVEGMRTLARTNYALTLLVQPEERLGFVLRYDPARFDGAVIARILAQLEQTLRGLATDGLAPLAGISVLTAAERHQLVCEENDTRWARPHGRTLPELFRAQLARAPEAVAVVDDGVERSYAELGREAAQVAHWLRAHGIGRGDHVAVQLERGWTMVPTLLGILEAGASYVPLELSYPAARVSWILGALPASAVIGQRAKLEELLECCVTAGRALPILLADGLEEGLAEGVAQPPAPISAWSALAAYAATPPPQLAGPEDLAYTIFTSGSTGVPKGVQVDHRAAVHLVEWVNETFAVGPRDRVLFVTSLCFDLSVYDLFGLLAAGGSVRIARAAELADPARLVRALAHEPITFWDSAPAFLAQLVPLWELEAIPAETALRRVFLSGDWIPVALPDQVRAVFRQAEVIALGGATEATVWSNYHRVCTVPAAWLSIPYGRPMWNSRYYVLDARWRPVGFGVPGDLFIAGACLAWGYAGDPRLTAQKFLADAFADQPGERMYRTGDRARFRPDGSLEFLGRLDHQVKVRGFRIELGEIEAVLGEHPAVGGAVVLAREDEPGRKRLVAYYHPRVGASAPSPEVLRAHLAERLPEYMVPAALVALATFPVSANGKLDRKALPAPEQLGERSPETERAPTNALETGLAEVFAEVLRRERVGVDDNFFELGGDSILSIQVVSRAARRGLKVQPRQLFEHPTVAELAAALGVAEPESTAVAPTAASSVLLPAQAWFFEQEMVDPHHFNQAFLLEVPVLDPVRLARALALLPERHEALRQRFERVAGGWTVRLAPAAGAAPLTVLELGALPSAERATALAAAGSRIQQGFDLARGPLFAAALFGLGPGEPQRLLLAAHHLVVDAVSWGILLEDLEAAYEAYDGAGEAPSWAPATGIAAWADWLAEHARSPAGRAEAQVWLRQLAGGEGRLPRDLEAPPSPAGEAAEVVVELGASATEVLLQLLPRRLRTGIETALVAAVAEALAAWQGVGRPRFDLERHGREPGLGSFDPSRSVGWLTAFVPLAVPVEAASAGSFLVAVKELLLGLPSRGLGFEALRHHGEPEVRAALAALPRAELSLNYLGQLDLALAAGSAFAPAEESPGATRSPRQLRRYAVELAAVASGGRLRLAATFDPAWHRPETLARFLGAVSSALERYAAQVEAETSGLFSASDFPAAGLSAAALEALLAQLASERGRARLGPLDGEIESIAALSPVQEGMLFESRIAERSGVYCIQSSCHLDGPFDVESFRWAWEQVLERHAILRSGFVWQGLERPLQVAWSRLPLPWEELDWRHLEAEERVARLAALPGAERERGIDLARPPLLRLTLVRLEEEHTFFHWLCHHLLVDGWSQGLIFGELFALYRARRDGGALALPRPRPFSHFVSWLEGRDPAAAEAFWRRELADFLEPSRLALAAPSAQERPADRLGWHELALGAGEAVAVRGFARRHGLTLNTLTQAAWGLTLVRWSDASGGGEDVVFGTSVAGRPPELEGAETIVGPFINTLPVRLRLAPDAPVLPWLAALQRAQAEARQHEHHPLPRIQQLSELPAGSDLFDTLLVFDNFPSAEGLDAAEDALRVREVVGREQSNYPLMVLVEGERLAFKVQFDTEAFAPADVERVITTFARLLVALCRPHEQRLGQLEGLSHDEQAELLALGSTRRLEGAAAPLAHEAFLDHADREPAAEALRWGSLTLSYAELAGRVRRLAAGLGAHGIGPEARVGIALERGPDMVVAVLGVLMAGAAYVPLDPALPAERVARIARLGRVGWVLAEGELPAVVEATLAELGTPVLAPAALAAGAEAPGTVPAVDPECLAYVLFTSGSTGEPKGVGVRHGGVAQLLAAMAGELGFGAGDRLLAVTTLAFDISVLELLLPLTVGGSIVLADAATAQDGARLAGLLAETRPTLLEATPAGWWLLLEAGWAGDPGLGALTGGEALPRELADRLLPRTRALWNYYGPTETTIYSTGGAVEAAPAPITIGRPLAGTVAYVADRRQRLVPRGVPGELLLAGAGLARGYVERPRATAERFLPDPWGGAGTRLYRVGDRVRWRADGRLDFLGRIDQQVKVRGFRVELGEIEHALAALPSVARAVVVARPDRLGTQRLVAYLLPAGAARPAASELRAELGRALPEYMVPSALVWLEAFPLTASGKLDRRALPAPELALTNTGFDRPLSTTEEMLAAIWGELLGGPRARSGESFFERGGHSLLAARLVSRLGQTFGVELPLRRIFELPTLEAMARAIDTASASGELRALPPIEPASRQAELPLSLAQQRLWFLAQLDPASGAYNIPFALRLEGVLDRRALGAALDALVARQEGLRSAFPARGGKAVLVVLPPAPVALPVLDLAALAAADREALARRFAAEEAAAPFVLETGPLLRAQLLVLGEREHLLLVTLHHIVADWWSMMVLTREVGELYAAAIAGRSAELAPLPVQYADFALWQRRVLEEATLGRQLAYWKGQLEGRTPALDLPVQRPLAAGLDTLAGRCSRRLDADLTEQLRAVGRRAGATLFMTLLAAFQLLLHRLSGEADVPVGVPVAGRDRAETEGVIGFFLNTLVLSTRVEDATTFHDLLLRVREVTLGAYSHQDVPFERVVEELLPARDLARNPLFDVLLNFLNLPSAELALGPLSVRLEATTELVSKFLLTLEALELPEGLDLSFIYRRALFDGELVEHLLAQLEQVLRQAAAAPERPLAELSLVLPEARAVLPNPTEPLEDIAFAPVLEQVVAWAARRPERPAIRWRGRELSYADYDRATEEVARALLGGGFEPGEAVVVTGQRSPGLLVALGGVFRAGGIFLPIDPLLPAERQAVLEREGRGKHFLRIGGGEVDERGTARTGSGVALTVRLADGRLQGNPPRFGGELPRVAPDSAANIFFTSGTTGVPKAVLGRHKSLSHFLDWQRERYGIGEQDRCSQLAAIGVDVMLREVFVALTSGATLLVPDSANTLTGRATLEWLESERVTICSSVPGLLQAWLEEGAPQERLESLRWLFLAGEPLPASLVQRWRQAFPAAPRVVNLYGCTETNLAKLFYEVPVPPPAGVQPAGVPQPGVQALVLAADGTRLCGIGELGEVAIRTPYLSLGYANLPEENARKFVANPFRSDAVDRFYWTGDSGRYRLDGTLEVRGRRDDQVKIRGVRIEPAEVNAVLGQHPQVAASAVVPRRNAVGEPSLVAYVVAEGAPPPTPGELANFLARNLPAAMVPAAILLLPSLPLTASGKIDRKALPTPEALGRQRSGALVPPRDALEHQLVQIWERVLGVQPIGVTDNFFELGGHSLLGVQLIAELRTALGRELPLASLFEGGTLEHQAMLLRQGAAVTVPGLPLVPVQPTGAEPPFFLVHPGGGGVMGYRALARALGTERPLIGLQARGFERNEEPFRSLPEMARHYVEALLRARPEGPHLLGGWSFGGLVAYEMARQLSARGREPALLVILDTQLGAWPVQDDIYGQAERAKNDRELGRLLAEAQAHGLLPPDTEVGDVRRYLALVKAHREAKHTYQPGPYAGSMLFFEAEERLPELPGRSLDGWRELVRGELEVQRVPGDHYTLIAEPHVTILAHRLREALARASAPLASVGEGAGAHR